MRQKRENVSQKARKDFQEWIRNHIAAQILLFVLPGSAAVIATLFIPPATNPTLAALYGFVAGAVALGLLYLGVYIYQVIRAPYKQRDEALQCINNLRATSPAIKINPIVYYEQAKLEVTNTGADANFTATARVVEGIVEPELYSMCWEPQPVTSRHIDKDGTATILVAEKARQSLNAQWAEKAVFKGGIALFKSVEGKREVFGASTMEQVQGRELYEMYPTMRTAYTLEDKCVIEVTLTSTPSLLEPFRRRYAIGIGERNHLLFNEIPTLDKKDSQT